MAYRSWTDVLPIQRSPRISDDKPSAETPPVIAHGRSTSVHVILCRLLVEWREDRDRLAVACAAWTLGGWAAQWLPDEVKDGQKIDGSFVEQWTDDQAWEAVQGAVKRRNRAKLHHQAEGLLFALEAIAQDAEAMELHRRQIESCMFECRELSLEERVTKLRNEDRGRERSEVHA